MELRFIYTDKPLGRVGEETNFKTIDGEILHVGDVVGVYLDGEKIAEQVVVKGEVSEGNIKAFIMGFEKISIECIGEVLGMDLKLVIPYTALDIGDTVGEDSLLYVVKGSPIKEQPVSKNNDDAMCNASMKMLMSILDSAIKDLKECNKGYFGLEFIKTMLIASVQ